ncbi:MAG: nucleoside deaminase [Prolixibacteraceae bacterium]|nr:nucleoside deaminase [Prolixibacteraceae bacterium]
MHPFDDEYFMRRALAEAEQAFREGEIPVGAIVVCQNKIIARAYNQTETLSDVTAHAEMLAITSATGWLGGKYLTGCTLFVTLEPCVMCAGALGWTQIDRIVWGAPDPKRGFQRFAPGSLHPKTGTSGGILAGECEALLKKFFGTRRK